MSKGIIPALLGRLTLGDTDRITVGLIGLQNILNVGAKFFVDADGANLFAKAVEDCGGVDVL